MLFSLLRGVTFLAPSNEELVGEEVYDYILFLDWFGIAARRLALICWVAETTQLSRFSIFDLYPCKKLKEWTYLARLFRSGLSSSYFFWNPRTGFFLSMELSNITLRPQVWRSSVQASARKQLRKVPKLSAQCITKVDTTFSLKSHRA